MKFCIDCSNPIKSKNGISVRCMNCYKINIRKNPRKGEKAGNYRGGRRINSQGYIEIFSPNHPNKSVRNTIREHRLVMENYLGRYLTRNEDIHHVNGNKQDNRLENLKLMSSKEHDSLHGKERWTQRRPLLIQSNPKFKSLRES